LTVYRQRLIDTLKATGQATHLVAVENKNIIGSVLLYPAGASAYGGAISSADWPEVRLMAVSPLARGQGVGAALVAECIRLTRSWGAPALGLHTMDVMKTAVGMYEKMGFVRVPPLDFQVGTVRVMGYRYDLAQ
jgi:GNAT superfamily N-acetyltransferase